MMPGLKDYPLYPYLEYRQITDDLMNQPAVTVTNLFALTPRFLPHAAIVSSMNWRREDWRGLLAFSPKARTTEPM